MKKRSAKQRGRPAVPKERAKRNRVLILADDSELKAYDDAAARMRVPRAQWIRARLNEAALRDLAGK